MLHDALRSKRGVAGQMHLAVFQEDVALGADQDGGIEPPLAHNPGLIRLLRDFRVAEVKADPVFPGGFE